MAKVKSSVERTWQYVARGAAAGGGYPAFGLTVALPVPLTNPLRITVTVFGCPVNPTVTAWLTDEDGDQISGTVSPPPSPYTVTFPEVPPSDYTLTVQVQCDNVIKNQTQDITLP